MWSRMWLLLLVLVVWAPLHVFTDWRDSDGSLNEPTCLLFQQTHSLWWMIMKHCHSYPLLCVCESDVDIMKSTASIFILINSQSATNIFIRICAAVSWAPFSHSNSNKTKPSTSLRWNHCAVFTGITSYHSLLKKIAAVRKILHNTKEQNEVQIQKLKRRRDTLTPAGHNHQ